MRRAILTLSLDPRATTLLLGFLLSPLAEAATEPSWDGEESSRRASEDSRWTTWERSLAAREEQDPEQEVVEVGPMRDWESTFTLNLDASISSVTSENGANGESSTSTSVGGSIAGGTFLTPHVEARVALRGNANSPAGTSSFTSGSVAYNLEGIYHVSPFEKLDPFAGFRVGAVTNFYGNGSSTDPSVGLSMGMTYNLSDSHGITLQYSLDTSDTDAGTSTFQRLGVGMVFYF